MKAKKYKQILCKYCKRAKVNSETLPRICPICGHIIENK